MGDGTSSDTKVGEVAAHWREVFAGLFIELFPCHCLVIVSVHLSIRTIRTRTIRTRRIGFTTIVLAAIRAIRTRIRFGLWSSLAGRIVGYEVAEIGHLKFCLFLFYLY